MTNPTHAQIEFDPDAASSIRIVLVGFMGAGKTTLAERWADSGGPVLWFDSDRAVLRELGFETVTDAFAEVGEARFREAERELIVSRARTLARGVEVWSLGGGSLQHADVRGAIADACVVWLDADADTLWDRVAGSDRPLARDKAAFTRLLEERRELYERAATVRVDATCPIEELGIGRVLAEHLPPSWFGSGVAVGDGLIDRLDDLAAACGRAVAIVADRAVDHLADRVRARLEHAGRPIISDVRLPMGEFNKQMSTVERVLGHWADAGLRRDVTVVAIGGGTLLDTAGFAASIYQRGVDWVSVPTTLTSQVDAGIGGKTGVNLGFAKNVVGSVHMPSATVIDTTVIDTLPADAIRDGFVEAAKTAMLAGDWLLERAQAVAAAEPGQRGEEWRALVEGCAGYKDAVVADDPFDTDGIRAQLNLGHTLAHAIEAATGGAVSHGAAVAIGTHAALHLSELVLDAPHELVETWQQLYMDMGIVTSSPLAWDELAPFLKLDKKHDRHGLGWVLLEAVGSPVTGVRLPVEAARRMWDEHVQVGERGDGSAGGNGLVSAASLRHPRVLVLFGVNLGELGRRESEHYGTQTLAELVHDVEAWAAAEGLVADCRQTDSLERFVHALHEARMRHHAVIVNPGAWTHHELSLHDALAPLAMPRVEVHLSDVEARAADEPWRATSVIRPAVDHVISGHGADGYRDALRWVRERLRAER